MKSKRKDIPKANAGMILAGAGQAAAGIGQSAVGIQQLIESRRALRDLQNRRPDLSVPTSLRQLAKEPIAEEFMQAQEQGAQRRTAQTIDTLGKAGSRGLGKLPAVMENERRGEMQRMGQYEQTRQGAMSSLASAEERLNRLQFQQYLNDLNAARMAREAGQQNLLSGFGGAASGASVTAMNIDPSVSPKQGVAATPNPTSSLSFKEGGVFKTRGKFSHKDNPKYLIDGNSGEVEAELTGDETVFNNTQSAKLEQLANAKEDKKLRKFVADTYKKFRAKRKS